MSSELAGGGADHGVAAVEAGEVRRALGVLARCVAGGESVSGGSRAQWAGLVASCQAMVNTASAVQDVAIARLAAVEEEWCEDGTSVETRRVLGHVALDAPDIVAGALGVSHVHAQRRVALAARLLCDGGAGEHGEAAEGLEPRGVEAGGAGLSGLHAAMTDGHLDAYRAGVVAEELAEAPAEVAEAVVGVLVPYLGVETAVQLRRRCRRALARISPDLLRQRAKVARESCGLRRWVQEPGVDRWEGTFPSEQAAEGWAAVDSLARRYVAEGRCDRVEAARARALMDLVRGQATIDVQLVVTVPAVVTDGAAETRPVVAAGPRDAGLNASSAGLGSVADGPPTRAPARVPPDESSPDREPRAGVEPKDSPPRRVGPGGDPSLLGSPSRGVPAKDARAVAVTATGPLAAGDEAASQPSGDDLVEVSGPFPGDPVLVGRAWIRSFLLGPRAGGAGGPRRLRRAPSAVREECHPVTGALLGSALAPGRAYGPSRRTAALVRARDGRCRFPGCSVAARFCDLDHVRPWPSGPTSAANLICLCRRHHRIKQRPGWAVRLHPDARAVWTDPTGMVRTSWPRDLLDTVVLPAAADAAGSTDAPATAASGRGSGLATLLEVLGEHLPTTPSGGRRTAGVTVPGGDRVHVVAAEPHGRLSYVGARCDHRPRGPHRHPGRRRKDAVGTGPPPF